MTARRKRKEIPVHLIVCEGSSEETYAKAMRAHLGREIDATLTIHNARGAQKVADYISSDRVDWDVYRYIWLAVDTDQHPHDDYRAICEAARTRARIRWLVNAECIETWILAHHDRPAKRPGGYSADQRTEQLRRFEPGYLKGQPSSADLSQWRAAGQRMQPLPTDKPLGPQPPCVACIPGSSWPEFLTLFSLGARPRRLP